MIERSRQRRTSGQQLFLLLRVRIRMFGVCVCRVGASLARVLIVCCSRCRHSRPVGMSRLLRRVDVSVSRHWPVVVRVSVGALRVTVATAAVPVVVALRSAQSVDEEHDDEAKHQRRTHTATAATQIHTVSVRVAARSARFALLVRV